MRRLSRKLAYSLTASVKDGTRTKTDFLKKRQEQRTGPSRQWPEGGLSILLPCHTPGLRSCSRSFMSPTLELLGLGRVTASPREPLSCSSQAAGVRGRAASPAPGEAVPRTDSRTHLPSIQTTSHFPLEFTEQRVTKARAVQPRTLQSERVHVAFTSAPRGQAHELHTTEQLFSQRLPTQL